MKKLSTVTLVLFLMFLLANTFLFAAAPTDVYPSLEKAEEQELTQLKTQDLETRLSSLERDLGYIVRRVGRVESQLERLSQEVKDLKYR